MTTTWSGRSNLFHLRSGTLCMWPTLWVGHCNASLEVRSRRQPKNTRWASLVVASFQGHLRHSTLDTLRKGPPTTVLGSRHLHYTICSWGSWAFLSFLNCAWLPHCRVLAPPSLPCDGSRNLDKTRNPAPTKCPPAILARGQVKATKHQATILPGAITCSLFHHIRNLSSKRIANLVNTESH